jgi:hypothetical protein
MFNKLKEAARKVAGYLSDAGHRRFVAMIVALGATHVMGKALDADSVASVLEIIIGGLGGAWASSK